jgi:xanthine dehydrogenase/oxidase
VGQPWSQAALDKALAALPADIGLSDTAPGGRIEYRRSLAASFTFKFFAHVALGLEQQGLSLVGVAG